MMMFIIGGSGSGKSAYAEEIAVSLSQKAGRRYYLATMQVIDAEGHKKADRHRRLRKGKGFHTIEQPTDIHRAVEKMDAGEKTALLECISNLTANEMFLEQKPKSKNQVTEKIISGIKELKEQVANLVVVSNNIFEDGIVYDAVTTEYIQAMGKINLLLADMADEVVEVVAGIPLFPRQ